MNYIRNFLNENENKSFVTNLKKYNSLNWCGRMKCLTSFYTHLLIDSEKGIDNSEYRNELLTILNQMELYKHDEFINWLKEKLN